MSVAGTRRLCRAGLVAVLVTALCVLTLLDSPPQLPDPPADPPPTPGMGRICYGSTDPQSEAETTGTVSIPEIYANFQILPDSRTELQSTRDRRDPTDESHVTLFLRSDPPARIDAG
ncbi:hypothetical protein K0M31_003839 [Melipona bicolor]|uniref:Uncharacterized protein n=1 Tax=Melipona bicolor TaxID=60889 RepID=A0AA40FYD0_9HYME|nr:hypothetical protein K0M31_003839 [Melipona bicolor]